MTQLAHRLEECRCLLVAQDEEGQEKERMALERAWPTIGLHYGLSQEVIDEGLGYIRDGVPTAFLNLVISSVMSRMSDLHQAGMDGQVATAGQRECARVGGGE